MIELKYKLKKYIYNIYVKLKYIFCRIKYRIEIYFI